LNWHAESWNFSIKRNMTGQVSKTCPVFFFSGEAARTHPLPGLLERNTRSLLQQVDDGVVIVLGGKGHAHRAGDIGGWDFFIQ